MGIISTVKTVIQQDIERKQQEYQKLQRGTAASSDPRLGAIYANSSNVQPSWIEMNSDLVSRYWDYERMDTYPELASALDIYADDSTINDIYYNKCIWPVAKDKMVRFILDDLMDNRLKIMDNIWGIVRTLAKYGNVYGEIIADKSGVLGLNYLPPPTMRRITDAKGVLKGYVQDMSMNFGVKSDYLLQCLQDKKYDIGKGIMLFRPDEIVHWKIPSKTITTEYGYSILDPARWAWRRLILAEDSSLVNKLARGSGRYVHYVDVGARNDLDSIAYVKLVRDSLRNKTTVKGAGRLDMEANLLSPLDDFWIPSRSGQDSTRIDFLSAPDIQDTELLEYFKDKVFSGIKVPKAYLGQDGGETREALSQIDMRFAKTAMRLQKVTTTGMRFLAAVHLAILDINPLGVKYDFSMTVPSTVFALTQLELRNAQADNADRLKEYFRNEWILEHVFQYSQDEAAYLNSVKQDEEKEDVRRGYETQAEMMKEFPEVMNAGMGMDTGMVAGMETGGVPQESMENHYRKELQTRMDKRLKEMKKEILSEAERRGMKNAKKKTRKAIQRYESTFRSNKK